MNCLVNAIRKKSIALLILLCGFNFSVYGKDATGDVLKQPLVKCQTLKGYTHILLAPLPSVGDVSISDKLEEMLVARLKEVGDVVRLQFNDMRGLGNADAILVFDIQPLHTLKGTMLMQSLGSLSLYASSQLSNHSCGKMEVWGVQGISDQGLKSSQPKGYLELLEPLMEHFTTAYQMENPQKRGIFYIYSSSNSKESDGASHRKTSFRDK